MLTLYDVAHFCSWNGYAEDMRGYLASEKKAWTNSEFWFPYGLNLRYGTNKKTRMQIICEEMWHSMNPNNIYRSYALSSYDAVDRVTKLLALGGNPNLADTAGYTPLLICARNGWLGHLSMIKALLKGGADINQREGYGYSALFLAALNGNNDIVKLLLQHGATVNNYAKNGTTPLYAAVSGGHLAIIKMLLAHGAFMQHDILKDVIRGEGAGTPILQFLYSVACPKMERLVQCAVYHDKPLLIRTLIKLGENPNVGDDGFSPIETAIILGKYECITELCKGGAIIETGLRAQESALHYAVSRGDLKAALILCRHGADTTTLSEVGDSVLHSLILYSRFREAVKIDDFRAILKYIKDFSVVNDEGRTPFKAALGWGMGEMAHEIQRAALRLKGK
jgi:ankyrin repeat protein